MGNTFARLAVLAVLAITVIACGGGSPTAPTASGSSGVGSTPAPVTIGEVIIRPGARITTATGDPHYTIDVVMNTWTEFTATGGDSSQEWRVSSVGFNALEVQDLGDGRFRARRTAATNGGTPYVAVQRGMSRRALLDVKIR